ncbi:MAG: SDR family oxidoreductase [Cyanobacteria bacterium Co-bin13]|nr:SDR family oxidoreductase [Cyanobacteria bacterium Co-bin13]
MVEASTRLRVLVVGATGGVGQLVVANLLEQGYPVRALTRSLEKVQRLFSDRIEAVVGDIRQPETLPPAMGGVGYLICATGTTAFPSARWEVDLPEGSGGLGSLTAWGRILTDADYRQQHSRNTPYKVDALGVANLVAATPADLRRFVFVSSVGIQRQKQFPFSALNAFGVLEAKQQGEQSIQQSGLPHTIIRPGRLIDGPYTSYDLNTLLQAKTQGKRGVVIGQGDTLAGDASRIDVAAACVACLQSPAAENQIFELVNQGSRPAELDWNRLFANLS